MLLCVNKLSVSHRSGSPLKTLTRDVSFALDRNQCLGIVGESGSGKSITCAALNGLLGEHFELAGEVLLNDVDLLTLSVQQRRKLRGRKICMILQSPMTAFDPPLRRGGELPGCLRAGPGPGRHARPQGEASPSSSSPTTSPWPPTSATGCSSSRRGG